jgi:ABC-2 type transport system ATP-binding protein
VLLTTHYMFEADALCDRIAVIANGQIVAQGTPQELKAGVADGSVVEVEVFGVDDGSVERVKGIAGVRTVTIEEREQKQLLIVQTAPGLELTHAILSQLNGASIGRVSSREPTLEDAYVQLVTAA